VRVQKKLRLLKTRSETRFFAVTIPCCANQPCRRDADDNGSAATDGVVVDLGFIRKRLKNHYSVTGRPSIDPEVLGGPCCW
jgi:hypothetical protein